MTDRITFCWMLWPFGNCLWLIAYNNEWVLRTKRGRLLEIPRV